MDEKNMLEIDVQRVMACLQKLRSALDGYSQGEIALAFSGFIAEQAMRFGEEQGGPGTFVA